MTLQLHAGPYGASVSHHGAELQSFTWEGHELLWNGDPAWWGRRAPLLFPVVGSVAGGHLRVGEARFPMPKHGFARDRAWEVVDATASQALLRLEDDEGTRAHYPFAFELTLRFTLKPSGLRMEAVLRNPGAEPLPAQFGFHPAFRWPLLAGQAREAHALVFDEGEPDALRQLAGDFIAHGRRPSPVVARTLALKDDLFTADALIWDTVRSRGARYGVPGEPRLRVRWEAPSFACWTKPGAPFLCLEPWQGLADEVGFTGDFTDRPGVLSLAPGASAAWSMALGMEATGG
ncbi:MAG: aldose 1-epimerase family protein [Acidobacteria bacterium]|nr:aldose 1-epimerase family protein [Acidobacteriota bacterium]